MSKAKVSIGDRILIFNGCGPAKHGTVEDIFEGSQGEKLVKVFISVSKTRGKSTELVPIQNCYLPCK